MFLCPLARLVSVENVRLGFEGSQFIRKEAETEGGNNNGRKEGSEGWWFYRFRWKVGEMICLMVTNKIWCTVDFKSDQKIKVKLHVKDSLPMKNDSRVQCLKLTQIVQRQLLCFFSFFSTAIWELVIVMLWLPINLTEDEQLFHCTTHLHSVEFLLLLFHWHLGEPWQRFSTWRHRCWRASTCPRGWEPLSI